MNIQLPTVIRDLTGKTGKAIIQAINEGQRSPQKLADLAHPRIRTSLLAYHPNKGACNNPPSFTIVLPVIYELASDAKKTAKPAISSGVE